MSKHAIKCLSWVLAVGSLLAVYSTTDRFGKVVAAFYHADRSYRYGQPVAQKT